MRVGPGLRYPIKWKYTKSNLPMEVINESGNWRQIKDWTGDTGWVLGSLLSGARFVMIKGNGLVPLLSDQEELSQKIANLEKGVQKFLNAP